jgi:hypothetical protein
MSAQITHVDPEQTIRKLRAKVDRLEKAQLAAMTVKDLMETPCQYSADGQHWEPALPSPYSFSWRRRLRDAWAVWKGEAVAVRQTTKADITKDQP